ncbi:OmpA family protein [Pseudotabrizicola sp. 4114]|uniref:OmpA family protein n=1 Tax=Pseudotabrizicola sp. 4114 TaxID=2817731 RepID=UPI00285A1306|nr:outer membrane protein OmpA-like peptidoglycan-associated protein [Pseudorhodobacter sp. 4114]
MTQTLTHHALWRNTLAGAVFALALPGAVQAAACEDALTALQVAASAPDVAQVISAWNAVQPAGCDDARFRAARSQTSALVARAAQSALAAGRTDDAEEIVLQAPGVHWAVQAVRGDIAAKRGNRAEAARMYNAALDTLGDPGQTTQSEQLVPVAERLVALAQENMMLAGSMESTVTRGGGAAGVMTVMQRGLAVEAVATKPEAAPAAAAEYVAPPADYVAPPADYVAPPAEYVAPPADYVAPAAGYVAPAQDYAAAAPAYTPPPGQLNVLTEAAKKVDSVFLPIRFGFDSDRLDASGVKEALRLSEFLKAQQVPRLVITGHTDDVGDASYNLDLSLRRAAGLRDFLLSDGVYAAIEIIGKGESQPPLYTDAAIYSLDELRTIARRVEIAFGH